MNVWPTAAATTATQACVLKSRLLHERAHPVVSCIPATCWPSSHSSPNRHAFCTHTPPPTHLLLQALQPCALLAPHALQLGDARLKAAQRAVLLLQARRQRGLALPERVQALTSRSREGAGWQGGCSCLGVADRDNMRAGPRLVCPSTRANTGGALPLTVLPPAPGVPPRWMCPGWTARPLPWLGWPSAAPPAKGVANGTKSGRRGLITAVNRSFFVQARTSMPPAARAPCSLAPRRPLALARHELATATVAAANLQAQGALHLSCQSAPRGSGW